MSLQQQKPQSQQDLKRFNTENCDIIWKATFDDRLKQADVRILCLLQGSMGHLFSIRAISTMIGCSKSSTWRALCRLLDFKYLVERGGNYSLNYSVVAKPTKEEKENLDNLHKKEQELKLKEIKPKKKAKPKPPTKKQEQPKQKTAVKGEPLACKGAKYLKMSIDQKIEVKRFYEQNKLSNEILLMAIVVLDDWLANEQNKNYRNNPTIYRKMWSPWVLKYARERQGAVTSRKIEASGKLWKQKEQKETSQAFKTKQVKELKEKFPSLLG